MTDVPAGRKHGKRSTYINSGCRCDPCRKANAAYIAERRSTNYDAMVAGLVTPQHGSASTYRNYACRCAPCTNAVRLDAKAARAYYESGRRRGDERS